MRVAITTMLIASLYGCATQEPAPSSQATRPSATKPSAPPVAALKAAPGQAAYPDFVCYAGLPMVIQDVSAYFGHLTFNPGCEILLSDKIHSQAGVGKPPVKVTLVFDSLEMHGRSTFHLEDPVTYAPRATGVPATPKQADGKTKKGDQGLTGYNGSDGKPSIALTLTIGHFDPASDGSLWIRTDGQNGGAAGRGGKGGQGSSGPFRAFSCPNGGDGGTGGTGGTGGAGADTSLVQLTVAGVVVPAEAAGEPWAPSTAPQSVLPGTHNVIVVSGAPGRGGSPGGAGEGGDPGQGHKSKCGLTTGHADEGNQGDPGQLGQRGSSGKVIK